MKKLSVSSVVLIFPFALLISNPIFCQNFDINTTAEGVEILENGEKVLFYQRAPKSLNGEYERDNYIHPLYGPYGEVITEDFPEDHFHQRGIFWAWHQIIVNNKNIADGWLLENIAWDVVDVKVKESKKKAVINTDVLWKSALEDGAAPSAIIRENATITVYPKTEQYRVLDFEIELTALMDDVKLGGSEDVKGYGGFSPRIKLPEDITFVSENKKVTPENSAVKAGPWMDFYGSFAGQDKPAYGIAVFCNPKFPPQPQTWILRNEKSMQNPVYPGREPVALPKGKPLILKYRMVIHQGTAAEANLEQLYQDYTDSL